MVRAPVGAHGPRSSGLPAPHEFLPPLSAAGAAAGTAPRITDTGGARPLPARQRVPIEERVPSGRAEPAGPRAVLPGSGALYMAPRAAAGPGLASAPRELAPHLLNVLPSAGAGAAPRDDAGGPKRLDEPPAEDRAGGEPELPVPAGV